MSRKKPFDEYKCISLESIIIDGVRPNINEIKDSEQIDSIKRIIEECWSQNPANRPSIKELVNFLEETEFYVDINFENMELNNVVANGIYGCVWSGFWPTKWGKVAAKCISCNQENLLDILREIHKLKALNHENIVWIFGISRHSTGCICAVIEYAECGSLYNLLHATNRKIFLPDKLKWMLQCARGLEYLRRENVVHQDLKTQNLLLFDEYQTLKICDFGSGMGIVESNLRSIESLFYTAPEVFIVNNKFTEKSRVYSFGIILWEVMTRKKPFENFQGMEPLNIQMEIIKGARPNINYLIHEDYSNLFNSIKEIIKRCWKESPVDRPTTMYLYEKFLTIINLKFV